MTVKFSAHSVGQLLVGRNSITDKQRDRLNELLARYNDPEGKPLTAKMMAEMDDLKAKRDQQFEFGATALSYIRDVWLANEHNYSEPVVTNEMLKGFLSEDEAIGVLTRQVEGPYRVKNEQQFEDEHFIGTPDVIIPDAVEDVKCSWTLRTFMEVQHPSALYYAQGQVYMALVGRDKFRLCHVLVPTPSEIVTEERKRFFFRFNCDEEDDRLQECYRKVDAMHNIDGIPEEQRIKVFEIERNDTYLMKLRKRVELAREIYRTLTLTGGTNERPK